jgi:hypothetical protein
LIRERGHPVEDCMDARHYVGAVDDDRGTFRRAQRHMQSGTILGDVDFVAAKHRVDAAAQPGRFGKPDQQAQGLVVNSIFGIVEEDARCLRGQPLASVRICLEQIAEVHVLQASVVDFERLPRCM